MTDHRSPDQIEHDLANTRQHLEHTLTELQRRFDPGVLTQRAITEVRENGSLFGRNLGATLRDNPVPAAMLGISLAWLMSGRGAGGSSPDAHALRQHGLDASGTMKGAASGASASAKSVGARASGAASDSMRAGAESMRAGMDRGRQRMAETGESMGRFYESNPMAAGAIAVAVGALAAAMLPRTRMEDEALGPYREQAREALRERADEAVRQAEDKAGAAAEAAVANARDKKEEKKQDLSGRPQSGPSGPSNAPALPTGGASGQPAGHGPSGA